MSASEQLHAELKQTATGDWVLSLDHRPVVGVMWDAEHEPELVVWDESGEGDGRLFNLRELFPSLGS